MNAVMSSWKTFPPFKTENKDMAGVSTPKYKYMWYLSYPLQIFLPLEIDTWTTQLQRPQKADWVNNTTFA